MGDRMRLTTLNVKNYRNLQDVTLTFEPDVTVLVGANNSGKSNLLEALYASLRINRTVRQGAFDLEDYHLANATAMAGDAGPIELTARFEELHLDEWEPDLLAALGDAVQFDVNSNRSSLTISVQSRAAMPGREEQYEWTFLNNAGLPLARKNFGALTKLQTVRPLYALSSLRDASREFNRRSSFFSPFVTDPQFDDALRAELVTALGGINGKVVAAHEAFRTLETSLESGNEVVAGEASTVTIEAVPSRLSELLANTQVSFGDRTGASLPLERHGSGSQSLAVLSLFRAFVDSKLKARLDPLSRPILTIEEPESHLHPTATRSLWRLISSIQAQIVLTSHSGDLAGEVPLRCIRRIKQTAAGARLFRADESQFDARTLRNLNYAIRLTRGELLLANVWLIVEGRSDAAFLMEIAGASGVDLLAAGIRVVEHAQVGGPGPLIMLADQLGIEWHCLCDGDGKGQQHFATAEANLGGRPPPTHLTSLGSPNLEAYLSANGFLAIYEKHASCQKFQQITEPAGTLAYAEAVGLAIIKRRKEEAALEVSAAVKAGAAPLPALLGAVFKGCALLAAR
jgi:putative ATP-dependent endonuclease of OLD family